MDKKTALKWIEENKEISPFTRNFVIWLYDKEGGFIANQKDKKKIDGMTMLADTHGMNPFAGIEIAPGQWWPLYK